MRSGWVKIYRQIEDGKLWLSEPFTKAQAWIDMLIFANHKKSSYWVRGNEVKVKRGQLAWSEVSMAKRWRWSRNKVRRFLKWLETEQQIEQQKTHITSLVTIIHYDKYQSETEQQTKQQKDNRRNTYKNDKNDKNINIQAFIDTFNELFDSNYKLTDGRKKKIRLRLKTYTLKDLIIATKKLASSDWHRGENDRGWRADPDFLIRSDEQVDKWLNFKNKAVQEFEKIRIV